MREILFKGKSVMGKWVEGSYYKQEEYYGDKTDCHIIITSKDNLGNDFALDCAVCDPDTIGQYTGLTDKNGKKIFEGDIIVCRSFSGINDFQNSVVEWCELLLCFRAGKHSLYGDFEQEYEVIGNIHDNPELLKGGADNDNV